MSKRKIAYARKNIIDPEEEGEELPFKPREIVIHKDYWFDRDYNLHDEILGRGKFGEVKRCSEISTGLVLAAKIVTTKREKEKEDVRKEIRIMSQLRHPKVLQIYDAFESSKKMCLITEIVEGGELFDRVVDDNFNLTERVAILFMRQIIDGIAYVHSQNILHLDMKPENIVCVAKTGTRIKIIDFGLAMRYDSFSSVKVMAGTVDFMAPEVCCYEDVTPATDMWSIGVICYVLVSGLSPFCGDDDAETICNIQMVEFDFAAEEFDEVTAGCKDFIKKLLIKDPRKRMTAEECMKHSWLNKISRSQTNKHLSKKHHIKFFVKRKWKKVIRAVIALNRLSRLVRQRKAELQNNNQQAAKLLPSESGVGEILDWRQRMEARIHSANTRKEGGRSTSLIGQTTSRSTTKRLLPSILHSPIKSSMSYSSGYESSGSGKSTATMEELGPSIREPQVDDADAASTTGVGKTRLTNKISDNKNRNDSSLKIVPSEQLEQTDKTQKSEEEFLLPQHKMVDLAGEGAKLDDERSTHIKANSFVDQEKLADKAKDTLSSMQDSTDDMHKIADAILQSTASNSKLNVSAESSDGEVQDTRVDFEQNENQDSNEDSSKIQTKRSTTTLYNKMLSSRTDSEGEEIVCYASDRKEHPEDKVTLDEKESDEDEPMGRDTSDKVYCPTDTLDDLVSGITSPKPNNAVNSPKSTEVDLKSRNLAPYASSRKSSYTRKEVKNVLEARSSPSRNDSITYLSEANTGNSQYAEPIIPHSRSRRSSEGKSEITKGLRSRDNSPQNLSPRSSKSDISHYAKPPRRRSIIEGEANSRRSSNNSIKSSGSGSFSVPRNPRSSRNNSREASTDHDYNSDAVPVEQQYPRTWSPHAVENLREKQYEYSSRLPGHTYDHLEERVIPIEIEHSPPPEQYTTRSSKPPIAAPVRSFDVYSDNLPYSVGSQRVVSSPKTSDFEAGSSRPFSRSQMSPAPDGHMGVINNRLARVARISGSTDSLDRSGYIRERDYSPLSRGTSVERRRARIASIIGGSQESLNSDRGGFNRSTHDPVARVASTNSNSSSRPTSRNNSDEARHRRIAAILANSESAS